MAVAFPQALQPYQIRQCVEMAIFWRDPSQTYGNGLGTHASYKYRDHSMERFVEWARQLSTWRDTHEKVVLRRPAFIQSEEKMGLLANWGAKLRKKRPEVAAHGMLPSIPLITFF